jgi:DNA sulfur modification protein DndC
MKYCTNCLRPISTKDIQIISLIQQEYLKDQTPWYIGFSGGKDSSAVLTLAVNALIQLRDFHKPITAIYCDTGVEIPTVSAYVKNTIKSLKAECEQLKIPLEFKIVQPKLDDRYFVKVIGRGYPPPTNIFRWCTDRLRINPVKSVIDENNASTVLLGIRTGESPERDRTIKRHITGSKYYLNQGTSSKTKIFSPIVDYSLKDVWSTLKYSRLPASINHSLIGQLYKDAGGECPVFKESKGTPCGKGRFGCWTCTVVRQDKSVESMIANGHNDLSELFQFRNWLVQTRNDKQYRATIRRNGHPGLGPITIKGRQLILKKLLRAEAKSGLKLIDEEEINRIRELWKLDKDNPNYREH